MKITWENVMARLQKDSKLMDWASLEGDIIGHCAEAAVKSTNSKSMKTETVILNVENGLAELPQDCFKFLVAKNMKGHEIDCVQESWWLKPAHLVNGEIEVVYKAMPIDENGYVIFTEQQYDYVYYYTFCLCIQDLYMMGKVPNYVWGEFTQKRDAAYGQATKEVLTTREMDKVIWLQKNARYYNINPKRI